jgi:hypothetical protein
MGARSITSVGALATAIAWLLTVPLVGQTPGKTTTPAKAWTQPRTQWGDPDLQGIWTNATGTPLERPDALKDKQVLTDQELVEREEKERKLTRGEAVTPTRPGDVGAGPEHWYERGKPLRQTSLVVDPPDGKIPPLTAWGKARADSPRGLASKGTGDIDGPEDLNPWDRCITRGLPGAMIPTVYNNGYQILQIPGYVVILYEMIHDARFIPVDGRPHLNEKVRQWMGDSRGRWEGNTLVVEATNFTENTAIKFGGDYHSDALRLVERFTRIDAETIEYQFTVNDSKTWTKPWTASIPMIRDDTYHVFEYACHEGNYAMPHRLSGQRAQERATAASKKEE